MLAADSRAFDTIKQLLHHNADINYVNKVSHADPYLNNISFVTLTVFLQLYTLAFVAHRMGTQR